MKGNSKRISGNSLSPLGAQNKDSCAASQTSLTEFKIASARQATQRMSAMKKGSPHRNGQRLKLSILFTIF